MTTKLNANWEIFTDIAKDGKRTIKEEFLQKAAYFDSWMQCRREIIEILVKNKVDGQIIGEAALV